jgi:hypothetical protein
MSEEFELASVLPISKFNVGSEKVTEFLYNWTDDAIKFKRY